MMATRRKKTGRDFFHAMRRGLRRRGALLVITLALAAGLLGGGWLLWSRIGKTVLSDEQYLISKAEQIEVNEPPQWVPNDIVSEVMKNGTLDSWNITDPELTVTVAQVFATHPWIARVKRVAKYVPARLVIDLEYRRPIAMVEVQIGTEPGLLPIDTESVLLPPDDFSPNEAAQYPRIAVGNSLPVGPVGTPWGDRRISGAALIIAALQQHWKTLDLHRVVVSPDTPPGTEPTYLLSTRGGVQIRWGRMPGHEEANEARISVKIARLVRYVADNGPFDVAHLPTELDVSDARRFIVAPRTATEDRPQF